MQVEFLQLENTKSYFNAAGFVDWKHCDFCLTSRVMLAPATRSVKRIHRCLSISRQNSYAAPPPPANNDAAALAASAMSII